MRTLSILGTLLIGLSLCHAEAIPVTADNFAQAETAWNFANWAKLGSDREIVHLRDVSPTGPEAPTVRMNWDTLYSVRIVNVADDHTFTVHLARKRTLHVRAHPRRRWVRALLPHRERQGS